MSHADLILRLRDCARSLGDEPLDKFLRKLLREAADTIEAGRSVAVKWDGTAEHDRKMAREQYEAHPGLASMLEAQAFRTRAIVNDLRETVGWLDEETAC